MKVYLKIHNWKKDKTVACCDENLLEKVFKEGDLRIEISEQFYGGELMEINEAIEILKNVNNFNLVGKRIIEFAIEHKILPEEGVRSINGVPMALKMMF
ncbi:MAG: DUF424 domain-containing protein [Promethearchaeia archaeon]